MRMIRDAVLLIFVAMLLMGSIHADGQDMLKQFQKQNKKINVSLGFRIGEPMGVNLQFYRGVTTGCRKSRSVIDVLIAKEGVLFDLGPKYKNGEWRSGGTRFAVSWFHEVHHRTFGEYLYYGIGVQMGSRKYQKLAENLTENFAWGPQLTLRGEVPVRTFTMVPHQLYCKVTLFAEMVYHTEIGEEFSYFKPAGGVRFNWFY